MKNTLVAIARPICRLIAAALWQLIWLVPVWFICWYGKSALPQMIRAHFGADQARDRLTSLEQFAELMKSNASLTNPTAFMHYLSAQLSKFSAATKLNTIEITSGILQSICLWGLNLLWIIAIIYAVIRTIRLYRAKSEIRSTAIAIAKQLQPQIFILQQEILALREEIQELKTSKQLPQKQRKSHMLTHE